MKTVKFLKHLLLTTCLSCGMTAVAQEAPKGKLIYCSYSVSRPAGQGKSFCELVADEGIQPKVVVYLNRDSHFEEEKHQEFPVNEETVAEMQELLVQLKAYEQNGYKVDESIPGAATYRFYMEYSGGDKVNATWSAERPKPEAVSIYNAIERFFSKWRSQVEKGQHKA
ncbi:MAG: hypothetical protein IJ144_04305 [Prevotella sp.]|nr:hypothetical protein [Prevotella sp.]